MHFQRPLWLLLLPLGIWCFLKVKRAEDPMRGWRLQMDKELLAALRVGEGSRTGGKTLRVAMAWFFMVLALAGPVFRLVPSPFAEDSASLVILLKADTSMTEKVSDPVPLLEAQLKIQDLVDARPGGKVALIAYAGTAHLVLPATQDGQVVAELAMEISPDILPVPGDDLPSAIEQAGVLLQNGGLGGSLVVFADRVEASASDVAAAWQRAGEPEMQFLSLLEEGDIGLTAAANAVSGQVTNRSPDRSDVEAIAKRAERQLRQANVEEGQQWAEDGWWLIFPAAGLFLMGFGKEGGAS